MIDLKVLAQKFFLACLVSQLPPDQVTILLCLKERDQVNTTPDLLAGIFTSEAGFVSKLAMLQNNPTKEILWSPTAIRCKINQGW